MPDLFFGNGCDIQFMKKYYLLGTFFIAFICSCVAQEITMYKTFGGVRFERDTLALSIKMVKEILRENPLAFEEFNKARVNYNVAGILGFAGGVLIGIPIGTAILGGNPEWAFAAGGTALVLASIQFNRIFKSRALHALDIFNEKVGSSRIRPEFYFAGANVRLVINF
ncbi:MAG: hypothetical protein JJE09_14460 [Bacteroidia bacterium]|nr:hypothetical protein [Bacteroidia bacterium]